jgi:predicted ATPase
MRIGISGTQNIGKSTVIKDFLHRWGMYTTPEKTYRDVLVEKGLPCNKKTTPETQTIIMNHLCDSIMNSDKSSNIITDRTPYDALAYSLWAHAKGIDGFDDEFIQTQMTLAREASTYYDIIFHIPIVEGYDVDLVDDDLRDTNPEFRVEIHNIFSAIFASYYKQEGPFFKWSDCPAIIEIFGSRTERMEMIKLYVSDSGDAFGEDDSLVVGALADLGDDIVGGEVPEIVI